LLAEPVLCGAINQELPPIRKFLFYLGSVLGEHAAAELAVQVPGHSPPKVDVLQRRNENGQYSR
jgi:hypothetical protein